MAPIGLATAETNGPAEIVVGRVSRRRPRRHTVVSVLLLAARFSFTTFVLSLAFWSMTSAISIVVLFLSRAPLWSSEAMWVHCFAGQQLLSIPLAWWRRRVLVRQRAEGRHLTQLELGLCYLQVHALVNLVGSMGLFTFGALIAIRSTDQEAAIQPLRTWQRIATVLIGSHFLLPLVAYYGLTLFFPYVLAGMAQHAAAQARGPQPPTTAGVGASAAGVLRGLGPDALEALPVTVWGASDEEDGAGPKPGLLGAEDAECAICCSGWAAPPLHLCTRPHRHPVHRTTPPLAQPCPRRIVHAPPPRTRQDASRPAPPRPGLLLAPSPALPPPPPPRPPPRRSHRRLRCAHGVGTARATRCASCRASTTSTRSASTRGSA